MDLFTFGLFIALWVYFTKKIRRWLGETDEHPPRSS